MNRTLKVITLFSWNLGFWILSLFTEIPYYFCVGVLLDHQNPKNFNLSTSLGISLLVGCFSLIYRALSLHLIGSWILKRVLFTFNSGPFQFGLGDFLLANIWIGIWAWLDPKGPTSVLFHDELVPHYAFGVTEIWFISILPIAFGSATFRFVVETPVFKRWGRFMAE
jgi:hypothetical protein